MSMRAAFTTEFIYDGQEGFQDRKDKMCEILNTAYDRSGGICIGRIAGITSGSDLSEEDIKRWIEEMCYDLAKITIVPFKIVWLFEGGDILIKEIIPTQKTHPSD